MRYQLLHAGIKGEAGPLTRSFRNEIYFSYAV